VIVRILLWRLDERTPSFEELRDGIEDLEPLAVPGAFLLNDAAERVGALVVAEEDEPAPAQLDELRALIGREPDLYVEFYTLLVVRELESAEGIPAARIPAWAGQIPKRRPLLRSQMPLDCGFSVGRGSARRSRDSRDARPGGA
jgi:hypothetical protein